MPSTEQEYLYEMSHQAYPFTSYHTDKRLNYLFSDIQILVNGNDADSDIFLRSITLSDNNSIDFVLGYASTTLINTTSVGVTKKNSTLTNSSKYRSIEYYYPANKCVVKVVLNQEVWTDLTSGGAFTASGLSLQLDIRATDKRPFRVNKLHALYGGISLEGGYNTQIAVAQGSQIDQEYRDRKSITLNFTPGAGFGKYAPVGLCDGETTTVRTFNGISPDSYGNFHFIQNACYWANTDVVNNEITIHNDCRACYDCTDVVNAYNKLKSIYNNAVILRKRIKASIDKYESYLNYVNQFKAALDQTNVQVKVTQTDFHAFDIVVQLQAGAKDVKKFDLTISYNPGAHVTATYQQYSGYYKVPGLLHAQFSPSFTGTTLSLDYTSNPANTPVKAGTYAWFYWNMHFDRNDSGTLVDITYSGTVKFVDGSSDYVVGTLTIPVTLTHP